MYKKTLLFAAIALALSACSPDSGISIVFEPTQPSVENDATTTDSSNKPNLDIENSGTDNPNTDTTVPASSEPDNSTSNKPVSDNASDSIDNTSIPPADNSNGESPNLSPDFTAGNSYVAGDVVVNQGNEFQCLQAGWCSSGHSYYEPGRGLFWEQAWKLLGSVSEDNNSDHDGTPQAPTETPNDTIDSTNNDTPPQQDSEIVLRAPSTAPCLPIGLFQSSNAQPNYCDVYDEDGREKMGSDHPRRIIGYFTSWRTGLNDQPAYLVNDIPWDKITHINYAFAHINEHYEISVGDITDPTNPATGITWANVPGAEMDPTYEFHGHFNLLAKYKKQYPDVKTLISVGGWAESGGHFNEHGRIADGGFYTLTINDNGTINHQAISTFAKSTVEFIRQYQFDGVDIDYEYPTSMSQAGNRDDFEFAEPRRAQLWRGYMALMEALRTELDKAGEEDNTHYLLTIASPASGYLLRGMETFEALKYLDYVNIMSYDLHGAWNEFVGPNAPLFDDGKDNELSKWGVYSAPQYGGIGYLNTDWAYHYFRGALAGGRINIGIPYYTRGWQNVQGGANGLWGTAKPPVGFDCPAGTGNHCGFGAEGIDNLWHDLDPHQNELFAGSNPMWHAKNLQEGIEGSYLNEYGLNPISQASDRLIGQYELFYDATLNASWLWNRDKKVFLSIEDEQSFAEKLNYVVENHIGGVMFWELAGDYDWNSARNEYFMGSTLTSLAYNTFLNAPLYETEPSTVPIPKQALDLTVSVTGFAKGDGNYPITPKITLTNHSQISLKGGTEISFDVGTSTTADIIDQSGVALKVVQSGQNPHGNNIGGLLNSHHRVQFSIPNWQTLAPGQSISFVMRYYLPITTPSNWVVVVDGERYALSHERPELPTRVK